MRLVLVSYTKSALCKQLGLVFARWSATVFGGFPILTDGDQD
jgi:hypothetical protein